MKRGVPVVCGVEASPAYKTIKKRAAECNSSFIGVFDREKSYREKRTEKGITFEYRSATSNYTFSPALLGRHQGKNAAVAIAASEQLSRYWKKLKKNKIIQGIESTKWDGRLEIMSHRPLVLADGAHNEEGAESLRAYVREFIKAPIILVFAVMREKKIERLAELLFPLAERVILTRFPYHRAASPQETKNRLLHYQSSILLESDAHNALNLALKLAGETHIILITGSLFLVGEAKKYFSRKTKLKT